MNAFAQLFLANLREFVRDRMSLFWSIAFPVIFIVLFGLVFSNDRLFSAEVGLVVEDQGAVAQQVVAALKSIDTFTISEGGRGELFETLKQGELDLLIVIPAHTSTIVELGTAAPIEVHFDPSRNDAQAAQPVVDVVFHQVSQQFTQAPSVFELQHLTVQSFQLRAIDFVISGILAMTIMQLGLFATAQPMIMLRIQGVLRKLSTTPLPRSTLLTSYVALRLLIALIQTGIIVGLGMLLFDLTMIGSWLAFVGVLLLGTLAFIAIGFFVAAIAKTEESGIAIANSIQFPMMFLSGVFFPVDVMPGFLRPIIEVLPLTYLVDAFRQIMIQATPLHSMTVNVLVLAGWLVVAAFMAMRFFKWDTT